MTNDTQTPAADAGRLDQPVRPVRDCEHGQLARSCDRCADQAEIAELRAEIARITECGMAHIRRAQKAEEDLDKARNAPSLEAAYAMGANGGPVVEAERMAFEAWMRGHCWALSATWTGTQYRSDDEASGDLNPHAMRTRQLWAAWRDRAALANGGRWA